MEQGHSLSWSDIPPSNDDEFTNFLEFGMQFPEVDGQSQSGHHASRPLTHAVTMSMPGTTAPAPEQLVRMDTDGMTAPASSYSPMMNNNFALDLAQHGQQGQPHGASYSTAPITPAFYAHKPPIYHQHPHPPVPEQSHSLSQSAQSMSQSYVPQGRLVIPPTPNSIEFHGNAATYPQRLDETCEAYERFARVNDEQALYTPLVSPAMTPLETQFRLPEYTIPGEYFTPLTSPALEAQSTSSTGYPFHSTQMSEMGFVPSPADNALSMTSNPSSPGLMRKHRRQPSSTKSFSARAKKQQSPSVRPQTRKKSLMSLNPDDVLNSLSQDQAVIVSQTSGRSGLRYASNESSGQDSVSPEPLSEPLMPPPALPPSRRSPAIRPQPTRPSEPSEPATPAMLMRIQRSPLSVSQTVPPSQPTVSEPHDDVMEDVILPEAATSLTPFARPQLARIETTVQTDSALSATPGSTTPALEPKSAPVANRNTSLAPSPRSIAMPSPSGPLPKKSDTPKLGPIGRKRQSLSSSQASPSLRPKISPSIQPLVRGDAMSSETSALYLASKSNYQHILDGTLLPGVSYPETLAENLSSKRTNHKLAEQGRRNRINNALKEIETLIPPSFVQMKHAKEAAACHIKGADKEKEKASNQPISKASTVEMAIDYIKTLQQELEETKGKLAAAENRLGDSEVKVEQAFATTVAENGPEVPSAAGAGDRD
ncbi:phosphate-sensing transcription factor PHO4 [Aspergillus homomorphus CBS 101889]|uniref:HLH transcription factor n=1 Tax=Aspergillus homomorphus (strain CBS 101889) TaxID=1450537 RepID=A0A395HM10_ASPHC|nr:HLH transcription factor [Aspergillus homomorphus CBS 101889]RAL07304.1 HLH transcription factor [Aspergillus homomorphus CBS 101889]